ncbi:MAG: metallophosphoesterase [Lachnospiraceae bacterium]|nr:metallophosphoesterase [Lachnospiraceae bacterium]
MNIKNNFIEFKEGQQVWVIGDVHGCYGQFMEILSSPLIAEEDIVVLVGDIIDRGPDSAKMLNWAIENVNNDGKYLMIRGNHEQNIINDFRSLVEQRERKNKLKMYVGEEPIDYRSLPIYDLRCKYGFSEYMEKAGISNIGQAEKYILWMESLPLYLRVSLSGNKKFVIAHAWFEGELRADGSIKQIIPDNDILWYRDSDYYHDLAETDYHPMEKGEFLIHGHTPVPIFRGHYGEPASPIFREHSVNIDGGCFLERDYGGRLIALCLNDLRTVYSS